MSYPCKVTSVCFYQLRSLRQIRNYVTQKVMAQLVTSLVISRLDYCNSALAGLPASTLAPLQRVQNAAARLVLNLDWRSHITHSLQQLHWLSIKYHTASRTRTQFGKRAFSARGTVFLQQSATLIVILRLDEL